MYGTVSLVKVTLRSAEKVELSHLNQYFKNILFSTDDNNDHVTSDALHVLLLSVTTLYIIIIRGTKAVSDSTICGLSFLEIHFYLEVLKL